MGGFTVDICKTDSREDGGTPSKSRQRGEGKKKKTGC
jgi:hypothetical protein